MGETVTVGSLRSRPALGMGRAVQAAMLPWRERLILASPFIAVFLLAVVSPSDDGPTICPFALFAGIACPGCGMTRAASHLVKGDFGAALAYHPLVPLIALMSTVGWTWFVLRLTGRVQPMSPRALNLVLIASDVALVAVWVGRLATGTLPPV